MTAHGTASYPRHREEFDMAVCRPNSKVLEYRKRMPTFTPAVDENDEPLMPNYRTDGYISAIAQSGGIDFLL